MSGICTGPESAVYMLDAGAYLPIFQRVEELLFNKNYIHRKGPYRVSSLGKKMKILIVTGRLPFA
jgi:hypothetical protein